MNPDETTPDNGTPSASLEMTLAKQANAAMAQGADPQETSQRLTAMIRYARRNTAMRQEAEKALSVGVDPLDVGQRFAQVFAASPDAAGALQAERRHQAFAAGTLQRGIGRINAAEQAQAADASAEPSTRERVGGVLANFVRDIPGGTAATAQLSSLLQRQSYPDALRAIEHAQSTTPDAVRKAMRVAGSVAAFEGMPGSVVEKGVREGLLNQLLNPNPDVGVRERLQKGVASGVLGGALGKGAELLGTGVRAMFAPEAGASINALAEHRADIANPEYEAFRNLGTLPETPALRSIIDLPVVKTAMRTIRRESPTLRDVPDTDARLLDAAHKRVGNKAFTAKHGFETGEATQELGAAMDDAAQMIGGSYAKPLQAYRVPSQEMEASKMGEQAVHYAQGKGPTTMETDLSVSLPALRKWASEPGRTPEEIRQAAQGVLTAVRRQGIAGTARTPQGALMLGWPALRAAPQVLNALGQGAPKPQRFLEALGINALVPTGRTAIASDEPPNP
jgi:hypothetical protein